VSLWRHHTRLVVLVAVAAVLAVVVLVDWMGDSLGLTIRTARSSDKTQERLEAIDRLGRSGTRKAEAVLTEIAGDPVTEIAARAVHALGRSGEPRNLPTLKAVAEGDGRPPVREAGIVALGQLGAQTDPTVLVKALETDPAPQVRATAAKWIGNLRYWEGMPALIQGLRDPSEQVRRSAYAAVRRLWARDFLYRPDADPKEREMRIGVIEWAWDDYRRSTNFKMFRWREEDQP